MFSGLWKITSQERGGVNVRPEKATFGLVYDVWSETENHFRIDTQKVL